MQEDTGCRCEWWCVARTSLFVEGNVLEAPRAGGLEGGAEEARLCDAGIAGTGDLKAREAPLDGAPAGDARDVSDVRDRGAVFAGGAGRERGDRPGRAPAAALEVSLGVEAFPLAGSAAGDAARGPACSAGALRAVAPVIFVTLVRVGDVAGGRRRADALARVIAAVVIATVAGVATEVPARTRGVRVLRVRAGALVLLLALVDTVGQRRDGAVASLVITSSADGVAGGALDKLRENVGTGAELGSKVAAVAAVDLDGARYAAADGAAARFGLIVAVGEISVGGGPGREGGKRDEGQRERGRREAHDGRNVGGGYRWGGRGEGRREVCVAGP